MISKSMGFVEAQVEAARLSLRDRVPYYIITDEDDWCRVTEVEPEDTTTVIMTYRSGGKVPPTRTDIIEGTETTKTNTTMAKKAKKTPAKKTAKTTSAPVKAAGAAPVKKEKATAGPTKRVVIVFPEDLYNKATKGMEGSFNNYIRGLVEKAVA